MKYRICFVGGARYDYPLEATAQKKFELLSQFSEITVIGFSKTIVPKYFKQNARFYLIPLLRPPVLRYVLLNIIGLFLLIWSILIYKSSIIVAQSPYEGFVGSIAKRLSGVIGVRIYLIIESHGDFERALFHQRKIIFPELYIGLMRSVAKFSLKNADALRSISNATRSQLKLWAPKKPIEQFPTWTDLDVFIETGNNNSYKTHPQVVLYVGVVTPLKGIDYLIKAYSKVLINYPETELWIIGKKENLNYFNSIHDIIDELNCGKRIQFLEPMSQGKLAKSMARATVLVLPSHSEGLGRVLLEAMACGIPVIGSSVGGIPEIIQDKITGFLVPPADVDSLSDRLKWVLEHPEESKMMGQKGRHFVNSVFSKEIYIEGYRHLFSICEVNNT